MKRPPKRPPKSRAAKNFSEIADEYGIDPRTLKKKLAEAGIHDLHGLILPKDQKQHL